MKAVKLPPHVEQRANELLAHARAALAFCFDLDSAVLVIEHASTVVGTRSAIADVLKRYGYTRQAELVRGHDHRIGVVVVVALDDGSAVAGVLPFVAAGAA